MNSLAQDLGAQMFAWSATALTHGLALFALVWAAERLELLRRPGTRQTAWRIVLLVPLISAALQVFVLGGSPISQLMALHAPAIQAAQSHAGAALAAPVAVPAAIPENLLYQGASLIGWAWLALVVAGALRLVVQCHGLWRYRRGLAAVSDPVTLAMAATLSRHAGLANVKLLDDPDLAGPIALPPHAVVLPSWTRDAFSDLQKKALLAHEIRHLARRDPQWRALHGLMALATLAPMAASPCAAWKTWPNTPATPGRPTRPAPASRWPNAWRCAWSAAWDNASPPAPPPWPRPTPPWSSACAAC
jgi:beta-lactamase regulating signal transducer with metallopeptidase domain